MSKPKAYYNEIDPFCVEWLRNLIKAGHIADGVVDNRSIVDVTPIDLKEFTQCHFFAGVGVWSLAQAEANRVGRLRAYGNAINAEAAKTFIEAAMHGLFGLDLI